MDINSGRIYQGKDLEDHQKQLEEKFGKRAAKARLVALNNLPKETCPICNGKGHNGLQFKNGIWAYWPCSCTQKEGVLP